MGVSSATGILGTRPDFAGHTVADMPWNTALHQYATSQRAAGRSPGTVRLHAHYLSGLARTINRPWLATPVQLLEYVAHDGWAPETRKSASGAVRSFYRWGHGMGYLPDNPALQLPSVKVPQGRPRPTPELIVAQVVRRNDRIGFMAQLGAYAGLRAGEIARVHGDQFTGNDLIVVGKGGKTRGIPIVHRGLAHRLTVLEGWAFPNGYGSHLSPGHVTRLLSDALPDDWTAHTLRHRMATQAYAGTRDLLAVGEVLGHSRPETTQRYVLLPDDARRAAVAAAC